MKPAEKPREQALAPIPVPPAVAQPPAAPIGGGTTVSPGQAVAPDKGKMAPFSDYDWTWLNGNPRTKDIFWDTKFFTPEVRADLSYVYDFDHPSDHSMGGSSELFRSGEVQMAQFGVGGDFHYDNVRARLMTQFGMYSETTPRNDASPAHGQWILTPLTATFRKPTEDTTSMCSMGVALRVRTPEGVVLLTGDFGHGSAGPLIRRHPDLAADVLQVPHHGRADPDAAQLAEAVRPAVAIIPGGRDAQAAPFTPQPRKTCLRRTIAA